MTLSVTNAASFVANSGVRAVLASAIARTVNLPRNRVRIDSLSSMRRLSGVLLSAEARRLQQSVIVSYTVIAPDQTASNAVTDVLKATSRGVMQGRISEEMQAEGMQGTVSVFEMKTGPSYVAPAATSSYLMNPTPSPTPSPRSWQVPPAPSILSTAAEDDGGVSPVVIVLATFGGLIVCAGACAGVMCLSSSGEAKVSPNEQVVLGGIPEKQAVVRGVPHTAFDPKGFVKKGFTEKEPEPAARRPSGSEASTAASSDSGGTMSRSSSGSFSTQSSAKVQQGQLIQAAGASLAGRGPSAAIAGQGANPALSRWDGNLVASPKASPMANSGPRAAGMAAAGQVGAQSASPGGPQARRQSGQVSGRVASQVASPARRQSDQVSAQAASQAASPARRQQSGQLTAQAASRGTPQASRQQPAQVSAQRPLPY